MNNTITIQELRRDPISFLRQINKGKTLTVIYRSRPFAVVKNAETISTNSKSMKHMLEYADLARKSAKTPLSSHMDYKETYREDAARKYGIS